MSDIDASQTGRMGKCAVTGKVVPEDELVDFQGQMVCAEGKAILLERLKAGESLMDEKQPPGFWVRFGCYLLDFLILIVPTTVIRMLVIGNAPGLTTAQILYGFLTTVVNIIYFGQLQASGGQSLGKRVGHLVVVNRDGSPMSAGASYVRALAFLGLGLVAPIFGLLGGVMAYGIASVAVGIWGLADCICLIVDRAEQRSLHDRIAGTRVIVKDAASA